MATETSLSRIPQPQSSAFSAMPCAFLLVNLILLKGRYAFGANKAYWKLLRLAVFRRATQRFDIYKISLLRSKIQNNRVYTLKRVLLRKIKNSSIQLLFVVDRSGQSGSKENFWRRSSKIWTGSGKTYCWIKRFGIFNPRKNIKWADLCIQCDRPTRFCWRFDVSKPFWDNRIHAHYASNIYSIPIAGIDAA